jgi:hypothetical protein
METTSSATPVDRLVIHFGGVQVFLRPMATAPRDGTGILVLLEKESLGRVWHSASIRPNITLVGHQFAFDCAKMVGWIPLPEIV